MDQLIWSFSSIADLSRLMPLLRAALACLLLYQFDCLILLALWLLKKTGLVKERSELAPENRHSALLVLPTLLRRDSELEGLTAAMRSVAFNAYPGTLVVVACIDGMRESQHWVQRLRAWICQLEVPAGVTLHVAGTQERCGKAVAMESGVRHVEHLVSRGELAEFPTIFFNMDADSSLGPRALERLAFMLTRRRRLVGAPRLIVTSNVTVPTEECWVGMRSLISAHRWIALLVAREYLTSISLGRHNSKLLPATGVSGALYCTWSQVHLAAPRYARYMQSLRLSDWLRWWVGVVPPRFSEFTGSPLPEAMTGPGDDTWVAWMACTGTWRGRQICFDIPRTPLHAFARAGLCYFSRPIGYDPLAKVYTRTPTKFRALFRQRLRWNSSRIQDLLRWAPSNAFHWQVALPAFLGLGSVLIPNTVFLMGLIAPFLVLGDVRCGLPIALLSVAGYALVRLWGSILALLVTDSLRSEWIKLIAVPLGGGYHLIFNTLTTIIGFSRDIFGFGEPTTFSPESTLKKGRLSRIAVAYRLRRAVLLAYRAVVIGDVPFGWFWFGWKETQWTPSGFDGWSTGVKPPPVHWPSSSGKSGGPSAFREALNERS